DELTAALGLARSISNEKLLSGEIFAVQKDLIVVMGELATTPQDRERYVKDGFHVATAAMVDRITAVIVDLEKDKFLYPKDWVIPGGTAVSAVLDFARPTCRRADRRFPTLMAEENGLSSEILRYRIRLA